MDWEIVRQDVMLEHKQLMHIYQESKTGLQAKLEAGIKFKKSTSKSELELDFVPVNLHIQQMKVTAKETENKGSFTLSALLSLPWLTFCTSSSPPSFQLPRHLHPFLPPSTDPLPLFSFFSSSTNHLLSQTRSCTQQWQLVVPRLSGSSTRMEVWQRCRYAHHWQTWATSALLQRTRHWEQEHY